MLESVGVVIRIAKNTYRWEGPDKVVTKVEELRQKANNDLFVIPEDFRTPVDRKTGRPKMSQSQESDGTTKGSRKEKSLGVLSQRFVQLFLLADQGFVSLEKAALQLMASTPSSSEKVAISPAQGDPDKLMKTKVRRLYDIANILSSINLIEKIHTGKRKPTFRWLGPEQAKFFSQENRSSPARRPAAKRGATSSVESSIATQLGGSAQKRRRTFAGHVNGEENDNPFDAETLATLKRLLDTFPPNFRLKWQQWIESAQDMLRTGEISVSTARDGVDTLLGRVQPKKPTEAEVIATLSSAMAQARAANSGNSSTSTQSPTQGEAQAAALGKASESHALSAYWKDERNVEEYMKRAREAGPEFEEKAHQWLKELRKWQSVYKTYQYQAMSRFSSAPGTATGAAASQQQPPPLSK